MRFLDRNSVAALVLAAGLALPALAQAPADARFQKFADEALEEAQAKQAKLIKEYRIDSYERYDWDQDSATLVFSDAGVAKVIATFQFVGSHSKRSGTWLWAWGNRSIDEKLSAGARKVRAYGEQHKISRLTQAKWAAQEVDAWEMAAVQAKLTGALGLYRSPDENGASFLAITAIRWAKPASKAR